MQEPTAQVRFNTFPKGQGFAVKHSFLLCFPSKTQYEHYRNRDRDLEAELEAAGKKKILMTSEPLSCSVLNRHLHGAIQTQNYAESSMAINNSSPVVATKYHWHQHNKSQQKKQAHFPVRLVLLFWITSDNSSFRKQQGMTTFGVMLTYFLSLASGHSKRSQQVQACNLLCYQCFLCILSSQTNLMSSTGSKRNPPKQPLSFLHSLWQLCNNFHLPLSQGVNHLIDFIDQITRQLPPPLSRSFLTLN